MADPTGTAGDRPTPTEPGHEGIEVVVNGLTPAWDGRDLAAEAVSDDERLGTFQRNQLFEAMGDTPEIA
ncbi:hypothetical protein [Nocardiopsis sp. CC223A]|uniref:hypothetical protein n=1 Tax=Nocardiopsis sp. CC223A TaxID=3044051 RepID=UPI00278C78C0|nr:hypothetical protein [Nocardiopsis sp. CC223A]